MQTPSEAQRNSEFGIGKSPPRRSIFGNYQADVAAGVPPAVEPGVPPGGTGSGNRGGADSLEQAPDGRMPPARAGETPAATLQSSIDTAIARTFAYRLLAKAFEDPDLDGWQWLSSQPTKSALWSVVQTMASAAPASFAGAAAEVASRFTPDGFDDFHYTYVTCFGHTVRGDCPMNEIEYGDLRADPLFQPHRELRPQRRHRQYPPLRESANSLRWCKCSRWICMSHCCSGTSTLPGRSGLARSDPGHGPRQYLQALESATG